MVGKPLVLLSVITVIDPHFLNIILLLKINHKHQEWFLVIPLRILPNKRSLNYMKKPEKLQEPEPILLQYYVVANCLCILQYPRAQR